jgi:hypothetical protein
MERSELHRQFGPFKIFGALQGNELTIGPFHLKVFANRMIGRGDVGEVTKDVELTKR